jgi:hypothetical protein
MQSRLHVLNIFNPEPVFVNYVLRSPGIDSQAGGSVRKAYFLTYQYQPDRLQTVG